MQVNKKYEKQKKAEKKYDISLKWQDILGR